MNIAEHIRFRFRDEDRDAQIVVGKSDYDNMINKLALGANCDSKIATAYLHHILKQEIVSRFGNPSNLTLVLVAGDNDVTLVNA